MGQSSHPRITLSLAVSWAFDCALSFEKMEGKSKRKIKINRNKFNEKIEDRDENELKINMSEP